MAQWGASLAGGPTFVEVPCGVYHVHEPGASPYGGTGPIACLPVHSTIRIQPLVRIEAGIRYGI